MSSSEWRQEQLGSRMSTSPWDIVQFAIQNEACGWERTRNALFKQRREREMDWGLCWDRNHWGNISKNYISFIKFIYFIVPSNSKKWNRGFPEISHYFTVPGCSLSRGDAVFKCHDQCTHGCECDNEQLTNCSHFLWQYHKSSLSILLRGPIGLVLAMMIQHAPYV